MIQNSTKVKRRLIIGLVGLILIISLSIGLWFFIRTPEERYVDLNLKATTWKTDCIQIGNDYIDIESAFMKKQEGALLEAKFYPVFDYVKLTFRNGVEVFPYKVTDFNAVVLDDEFYDWTICYYEDQVLLINTGSTNYFLKLK